jgi:hypothetical protein
LLTPAFAQPARPATFTAPAFPRRRFA